MRRINRLLFAFALCLGCSDPASAPDEGFEQTSMASVSLDKLRREMADYTVEIRSPRNDERLLIERILSNFQGDEREVLRLVLFDSVNHHLYTLGNPRLDGMLKQLYDMQSSTDPEIERQTNAHPAISERVATRVTVQEQIGHLSAIAIILRDPNASPPNQVLLRSHGDGGAGLLAAVAALQDIWRQEGVQPTTVTRLALRAPRGLGKKQSPDLVRARKWFARIQSQQPSTLDGRPRTAIIHIGRAKEVRYIR